jgi:hypothetical protein
MAAVRATITIDLPDGVNFDSYINAIRREISNITGIETKIAIKDVDDPISLSPVSIGKLQE